MSLFSSRDDRRRRLLTEETADSSTEGEDSTSPPTPRRSAPTAKEIAQRMERIPRITDLIPRHRGLLALLFLGGLLAVVGLEAVYFYAPQWPSLTGGGHLAAIDLAGEGSLAVWFSSTTMLVASLTAWLVYLVRRQQPDDYHGRYRIWLWAAACWMIISVDEGASLHEGFQELMIALTHQPQAGHGSVWWIGAYGLLLGGVGLRLLMEMRTCISSTTSIVIGAVCYAAAVIVKLQIIPVPAGTIAVMVKEGCEMVGNLFLLLSMTLHARYVILDAEGLLPKKAAGVEARKTRKVKAEGESASAVPTRRSDLTSSAKPTTSATLSSAPSKPGLRFDSAVQEPGDRRLTKAERKAIRRQMREHERDDSD